MKKIYGTNTFSEFFYYRGYNNNNLNNNNNKRKEKEPSRSSGKNKIGFRYFKTFL